MLCELRTNYGTCSIWCVRSHTIDREEEEKKKKRNPETFPRNEGKGSRNCSHQNTYYLQSQVVHLPSLHHPPSTDPRGLRAFVRRAPSCHGTLPAPSPLCIQYSTCTMHTLLPTILLAEPLPETPKRIATYLSLARPIEISFINSNKRISTQITFTTHP